MACLVCEDLESVDVGGGKKSPIVTLYSVPTPLKLSVIGASALVTYQSAVEEVP